MKIEEVILLREQSLRLNLRNCEKLLKFTPEALQNICNGIGPECLPECLRDAMSAAHPTLKVVAFMHDLDFATGNGTWADFCKANENFYINGIIAANAKYAWYHPLRYIVRYQAKSLAAICQTAGWYPYLSAVEEFKKKGYAK